MAIRNIAVRVETADAPGAGTDGRVYVGLGGREFYIDMPGNDLERGMRQTFVLGDGATIKDADKNDPRRPAIDMDDIRAFPAYIRFEPRGDNPNWKVKDIEVDVVPDGGRPMRLTNPWLSGSGGLWIGQRCGEFLFLRAG